MLEPTSGYVTVEGLDNRKHIQDVRQILGFCPQYGKREGSDKRISC
jgi:ABC-type multidrug transport system ATPase subunit